MDTTSARTEVTKASDAPLGQDWLRLLRHWLGNRRVQIALAAAVIVGGAALNWGWLVAIGLAPIILAVLPCAAMCALGMCVMGGKGKAACGKDAASDAASDRDELPSETKQTRPPVSERDSV